MKTFDSVADLEDYIQADITACEEFCIECLTTDRMAEILEKHQIATNAEIQLVAYINGWNKQTMLDILDVRTGLKNFEQLLE